MMCGSRIQWLITLIICTLAPYVSAFSGLTVPLALRSVQRSSFFALQDSPINKHQQQQQQAGEAFVDDLDEERRSNLFQFLLRDLQIEGVPLLGCDADQVHTLQAALWTTMAELVDQDAEQRVCMIFENIPINALRTFVDDLGLLKLQQRLMEHLPELERLSVSLVGKGVGPAILMEVTARSSDDDEGKQIQKQPKDNLAEFKATAAIKAFVDRMILGMEACPHFSSSGTVGGTVGYRYSTAVDICGALSTFWNCICELSAVPQDQLSSILLTLPSIAPKTSSTPDAASYYRFAAVAEVVSRSLLLYQGDSVFDILHFHPTYDRNLIHPVNQPAHGHLPPQSWLRPMLRSYGENEAADRLTEDDLALSNFQRRSPLTAICIKRVSMLDAVTDAASGIVDLDLGNGEIVKASGVPTYCRNLLRLAKEGKDPLEASLQSEIAIAE